MAFQDILRMGSQRQKLKKVPYRDVKERCEMERDEKCPDQWTISWPVGTK